MIDNQTLISFKNRIEAITIRLNSIEAGSIKTTLTTGVDYDVDSSNKKNFYIDPNTYFKDGKSISIESAEFNLNQTITQHTALVADNSFKPVISKYTTQGTTNGKNVTNLTGNISNSEPNNGFYIAVKTLGQNAKKITTSLNLTKNGFLDSTNIPESETTYVGLSASDMAFIPISESVRSITGGELVGPESVTPTVSIGITSSTIKYNVTNTGHSSHSGDNSFYIDIGASSESSTSTIKRNEIKIDTTSGFVGEGIETISEATSTFNVNESSASSCIVIKKGSISNGTTDGETYTAVDGPSLIDGKLYINEGYYSNTEVSLGDLIPDITNDATDEHILAGHFAYNDAGNIINGAMATVSLDNYYYVSEEEKNDVPVVEESIITKERYTGTENMYIKKGGFEYYVYGNMTDFLLTELPSNYNGPIFELNTNYGGMPGWVDEISTPNPTSYFLKIATTDQIKALFN